MDTHEAYYSILHDTFCLLLLNPVIHESPPCSLVTTRGIGVTTIQPSPTIGKGLVSRIGRGDYLPEIRGI